MANDMKQEPDGPDGTGNQTPPPPASTLSRCAKKYADYIKDPLAGDVEVAAGAQEVACLGYEENRNNVRLRICRQQDALEVHGEYLALRNAVSSTLAAHAAGVAANTESYEKKNGELDKKLDVALKAIKKVKDQMAKVNSLACKLERMSNDPCTIEERNIIDTAKTETDYFKREANEIVKKIKGETDDTGQTTTMGATERADDLFDMVVKYSGIQASTNVLSIKPMAKVLVETADGLVTDVVEQITTLEESIAGHQAKLDEGVAALSTSQYERYTAEASGAALEALGSKLDELVISDCGTLNYAGEIEKFKGYCIDVIGSFGTSSACSDDDGSAKFSTQDAPSC